MESWVNESWTQRHPLIRKSSRVFMLLTLQRWRFPGSRPQVWAPACPPPSSCHHPGYSLSGALGKSTVILLSVSVQSRPLTKRGNGQGRNASRRDMGRKWCHVVISATQFKSQIKKMMCSHFEFLYISRSIFGTEFYHLLMEYSDKSSWWSLLNFFKS